MMIKKKKKKKKKMMMMMAWMKKMKKLQFDSEKARTQVHDPQPVSANY